MSDITGLTKIQVAMCLQTKEERIIIERPPCKQQTNGIDCGAFAIANAVQFISEGSLPHFTDYETSKMRQHLFDCLLRGMMTPFPVISTRKKKIKADDDNLVLKVYCVCRLPDSVSDMCVCDVCDKPYHFVCEGVNEKDVEGFWACSKCVNASMTYLQ